MPEARGALVEERVAQLRLVAHIPFCGPSYGDVTLTARISSREIHRRRSDLLVEMFHLMKRKEDLSNMATEDADEDKAELNEFMENMDLMKQ